MNSFLLRDELVVLRSGITFEPRKKCARILYNSDQSIQINGRKEEESEKKRDYDFPRHHTSKVVGKFSKITRVDNNSSFALL